MLVQFSLVILITAVISALGGYLYAQHQTHSMSAMDMMDHNQMEMTDPMVMDHAHENIEAKDPVPTLSLVVHKDPMRGWNAELITSNFTFAPDRASTQHVPGEGHAHIYLNGQRVNRVYSNWYHLGELPPGRHRVSASLATNNHDNLTHLGGAIAAEVVVEVR